MRTVRYLRPVQIYGRLWYKLHRPSPDVSPAPPRRYLSGLWVEPAQRPPSLLNPWTFRFLNEEHKLEEERGWDNPKHSKLWRYHLHYFDDLNAEAASSRRAWHQKLLSRWVSENPPARGTGWEPYPTSLRIVNWIKWSLAGNALPVECVDSLAVQANWLAKRLEYHLLGNHLFSNAKSLVFAGLFFEGYKADHWRDEGFSILAREIPEQILSDGGHFERSPMYHALALEDMLDLCNVTSAYSRVLPDRWSKMVSSWPSVVASMRRWLAAMCHPDGDIAFFNDAAFGSAPASAALEQYACRLGGVATASVADGLLRFKQSGYIRVENNNMVALLDVALVGPEYLPGHAHADTLSFELSMFGSRIFVNSGTSCYEQGVERSRQRGTASHNTVVIDSWDSSEVWAGFRVGRRAYTSIHNIIEEDQIISISASHDGYSWLPGRNRHLRRWRFGVGYLSVEDEITGCFREAVARYHLHPNVGLDECSDEHRAVLLLPRGQKAELVVEGGVLLVEPSTWHPQFGMVVPNLCLAVYFQGAVLKTVIRWEGTA